MRRNLLIMLAIVAAMFYVAHSVSVPATESRIEVRKALLESL